MQSLQLYIKSILLLGRVVGFMQSVTTAEISLGSAASLRSTPAFDTLAADLLGFRATTSSLRENNSGTLSIVKVVPWAATILLHENFATMEADGHHDLMLAEESARCILDSIYGLWSTSPFLSCSAPLTRSSDIVRDHPRLPLPPLELGCRRPHARPTTRHPKRARLK